MRRALVVVILMTLLIAGCVTDRRANRLQTTLNAYASALRWDHIASGLVFVDPAVRKKNPLSQLDLDRYAQLRVSSYEVQSSLPASGPDDYRQVVEIGLINRNTQTVRHIVDRQVWHWDAKTQHWWLESGLPKVTGAAAQ